MERRTSSSLGLLPRLARSEDHDLREREIWKVLYAFVDAQILDMLGKKLSLSNRCRRYFVADIEFR
jgi:hypothetical protein